MLKIKICPSICRAVESLLHEISVVGMNSLEYQLQRRLNRSIVLKDLVGFLRPVDLSTRNVPAEAAGVAYVLPLSQESFAALQIRIEAGILQRNRSLGSQQLQHFESVRGEGARSQIVLQIKCADKLRLFDDGQAEDGSGALLPHIFVLRIQIPDRSVIKDHALPRPDHVMKRGLGEIRCRDGCLSHGDLDPAVAGGGLRLDPRLVAPEEDEQTPLGSCMLHRDSHELLDQLVE